MLLGVIQQFQPPLEAHGCAERVLMRGRDENQAACRMPGGCIRKIEAVRIDRDRADIGADQPHGVPDCDMSRIFTPNDIIRFEENGSKQSKSLLCA